jgi:osmotically-inducible protein OsmY
MEGRRMGSVIRGVFTKGPTTEARPAPETRADADIIAEFRARLSREAWVADRGIWVDVQDGTIALVGIVNSEGEKAALATMAREIDGCKGIENHLLVRSVRRDYGAA